MRLTPWEEERLLIFGAAELARRHRAAGIALNAPEAVALMCDAMLEAARAGAAYAEVESAGLGAVTPDEVLPGVRELIDDVRLEVLLRDGARLIVLVDPLGRGLPASVDGPGAILPGVGAAPPEGLAAAAGAAAPPEGLAAAAGAAAAAAAATAAGADGRERREVTVTNTSRRVVRVSSHFPFDRVNSRLEFDRASGAGFRLDLEAGSTERWGPGETRTVRLVRFGGEAAR
jgi:urease subunit gamma/beta